jgi:hypothetical protein
LAIYCFYNEQCDNNNPLIHVNVTKRKLNKTYGPNGSDKAGSQNCFGRALGLRVLLWDAAGNRRSGMWIDDKPTTGSYSKYDTDQHPFRDALRAVMSSGGSRDTGSAASILRDRDSVITHLEGSIRVNKGLTIEDA